MSIHWYDLAGIAGVTSILVAYLLLQIGRMNSTSVPFSLLNLAGALLITLSLFFEFNLSAFLMETAWAVISLIGIWRALAARRGR